MKLIELKKHDPAPVKFVLEDVIKIQEHIKTIAIIIIDDKDRVNTSWSTALDSEIVWLAEILKETAMSNSRG